MHAPPQRLLLTRTLCPFSQCLPCNAWEGVPGRGGGTLFVLLTPPPLAHPFPRPSLHQSHRWSSPPAPPPRALQLEEGADDVERAREVYERAVSNLPPGDDKRYWRRWGSRRPG